MLPIINKSPIGTTVFKLARRILWIDAIIPRFPIQVVTDYYDRVHDYVIKCLKTSSDQNLNRETRHETRGVIFSDWIWGVEESHHLGQIAHIKGIIRGMNL